jgi:DNA (cytosine-5)-methyltransferase 1
MEAARMHKAIDLFAGCGGLTLGFQRVGFTIAAAFDNWKPAIEVYRNNFSNHPMFELDLGKADIDADIFRRFQPDIIIGGPPCQDFSSAGKRDESLGRANLTVSFAAIVAKVLPEFFVMENVERIHSSRAIRQAIKIFRDNGYGLTWRILDASLCGVPQKRKRFFLVGHKGAADEFLGTNLDNGLSSKPMTIRDYLGDSLGVHHFYRHPRSYERRGIFSIDEPSPTIRGVNRPIPEGYEFHPGDSAKQFHRVRPLTTIERSYIQTFPKGFVFQGSKSDLEQMIGNAVPVKLAEYVAKCLRSYIQQLTKSSRKGNGIHARSVYEKKAV